MLMIDTVTGQIFEASEEDVNRTMQELNNKLLRDGILYYSDCPFIPVYTNLKSPDVSNYGEVFHELAKEYLELEYENFLKEF